MAIPVARVHLKVAHAALPALLPTPPKWRMLRFLSTPPCAVATIHPATAKQLAKPSRADSDERWDAHKTTKSSASSSPRSSVSIKNSAAGRGFWRRNATSPPPKPGRADAVDRWDAHKKVASPASSSSSSSGSKCSISRASSAERWDVRKKLRPPQAELLDDGDCSSTGSNDDMDTEEEILWKPRAMYAGPGFAVASPVPTSFLVPVA